MSKTAPSVSPSTGDDRNLIKVDETYAAPGLENHLRAFWTKYSRVVVGCVIAIAAVIVIRGVMSFMADRHDTAVRAAYAATGDDAAKLKAFIADNASHRLAGVAGVRVADNAYAAGDFAAAAAAYKAAADVLGDNALADRALIGAAVSLLQAGDAKAGQDALAALADDVKQSSAVRAEAAYHLAVLARQAGDITEAGRRADQVLAIATTGLWAQRAMMLRSSLPATTEPAPAGEAAAQPAVSFPPVR